MAGPRRKKSTPARPYTVLVYRVNGLMEVPIPAGTPPEDGRRQAVAEVLEGIRLQPDGQGPRLFFGEARELVVAVLPRDCCTGGA